jgi:predicted HicB family RNase H-like nuclease
MAAKTLIYKGFEGAFEFDAQAGLFTGLATNTRDVITFQGETIDELNQAFRDSIDDYLEFCRQT